MSSLAVLLLCIQACLIQNALAVCYGAGPLAAGIAAPWSMAPGVAGPYGIGSPCAGPLRAAIAEPFGFAGFNDYRVAGPCGARYGGAGIGNVAVAGEIPVGGATALAGQVPIIGAVEYAGPVAAAGVVSIAGTCACGCGAPGYEYGYGIY